MNYIILDLEWNQGNEQREKQLKELPFEIIEIGAVKLNSRMEICDSFHELIRPQVYKEMHYMTKKLLQLDMDELQDGRAFPEVIRGFLAWCGTEEFMFGTWGAAGFDGASAEYEIFRSAAAQSQAPEVL